MSLQRDGGTEGGPACSENASNVGPSLPGLGHFLAVVVRMVTPQPPGYNLAGLGFTWHLKNKTFCSWAILCVRASWGGAAAYCPVYPEEGCTTGDMWGYSSPVGHVTSFCHMSAEQHCCGCILSLLSSGLEWGLWAHSFLCWVWVGWLCWSAASF